MINRAGLIGKLNEQLAIQPERTAVLLVDMHRGHLDPAVATKPVDPDWAKEVVRNTLVLMNLARKARITIIHAIVEQRILPGIGREGFANPRIKAVKEARLTLGLKDKEDNDRHNIEGSVQTEVMPELAPRAGDFTIRTKRRLSCFYGTDLEILLRSLKTDTLLIAGINTNTCVQGVAFEAHNRDYRSVVISDCVASMYGRELHDFALKNIGQCFGWVLSLEELRQKLDAHRP
jgi:biuret amidohydrolase